MPAAPDAAAQVLGIHFTLFEQLLIVYAFIFVGLLICVQIANSVAETPSTWAKITKESRLSWYTIYVLEAFLFVHTSYPMLKKNMESFFVDSQEQRILNTVWIGLLSLETLMVVGVAVQGLMKRFGPQPKQKTN